MKHSDSFVITVDKDDTHHIVDTLELSKYALKAQVDRVGKLTGNLLLFLKSVEVI